MKRNNRNQGGCEQDVPSESGKRGRNSWWGKGKKKMKGWEIRED